MKAAHEAAIDRPGLLIKAEEASDIYFVGGSAPSLLARRTWNLLIQAAAGEGWKEQQHCILKRELRAGRHVSPQEISDCLVELQRTLIQERRVTPDGKPGRQTVALLGSTIEHDHDDDSKVWFRFDPVMCDMLRTSRYYVELERLVFLHFECKYSFPLYERGVRKLRDKQVNETIKLIDLRGIFGIEKGKLKTWQALRTRVIEAAVAEVNQLAPFTVRWLPVVDKTTKRHNPPVIAVQFWYDHKDEKAVAEAKAELARPRVGRTARRQGIVEQIAADDAALAAQIKTDLAAPPPVRQSHFLRGKT